MLGGVGAFHSLDEIWMCQLHIHPKKEFNFLRNSLGDSLTLYMCLVPLIIIIFVYFIYRPELGQVELSRRDRNSMIVLDHQKLDYHWPH